MTFSIVTDSAADIEDDFAKKENIYVVPTIIILNGKEYKDGDLTRSEFIEYLKSGNFATTSLPSPLDFQLKYEKAIENSPTNEVLGIHITSKLSGTYNGARIAANEFTNAKILIFDSLHVSIGTGYLVFLAAFLRGKGYPIEQVYSILEKNRSKIFYEILIDDLKYLKRSGRINLAQFSFLKFLNIRPILTVKDGLLVTNRISFGYKNGIKKIIKKINSMSAGKEPVVLIGHLTTPGIFQEFNNEIDFKPSDSIKITICTTLAAHAGPGVIGLGIGPSLDEILSQNN